MAVSCGRPVTFRGYLTLNQSPLPTDELQQIASGVGTLDHNDNYSLMDVNQGLRDSPWLSREIRSLISSELEYHHHRKPPPYILKL